MEDDGPMPKKKPELLLLYQSLKHRSVELANYEAAFANSNNDSSTLDVIQQSNTQNEHQTDTSLSSEERDAALALGSIFLSVWLV